MPKFTKLSVAGILFVVCGCSEVEQSNPNAKQTQTVDPKVIESVYMETLPFAFAEQVAKNCRSIRLKQGSRREEQTRIRAFAEAAGVTERQLVSASDTLSKRRIQQDAFAFLEEYGIVVNDGSTWCDAGQKMIVSNDRYGRFLVSMLRA